MMRSYTFRMKPNKTQALALNRILSICCDLYNAALQERHEAWKLFRKNINYYDQQAQLTRLHQPTSEGDSDTAWLALDVARDPLRRVERSFQGFFARWRRGEKPGYPRFRPASRYDSFTFGGNRPVVTTRTIRIPKVGDIRIRITRPLVGIVKSATIKRLGKNWIACIACDIGPAPKKCAVSNPIGIDLGLLQFATLSDGRIIENPKWLSRYERRIAAANRSVSKKQKRSKNRSRAKEVLRRLSQRVRDSRKNFSHHLSKWLVVSYDLIAFEKLNIRRMAESNWSKAIFDAAWGELVWQISYKAESAGRWAIPVNPNGTSSLCSTCGEDVPKALSNRRHICACGASLDRDHNAAINILALGVSAAGLGPSQPVKT